MARFSRTGLILLAIAAAGCSYSSYVAPDGTQIVNIDVARRRQGRAEFDRGPTTSRAIVDFAGEPSAQAIGAVAEGLVRGLKR